MDPSEKTICRKKVSDYFGDFEYLCGLDKRYSRAICMSNHSKIFELKVRHINWWLKENLENIVHSKISYDLKKVVQEKTVIQNV